MLTKRTIASSVAIAAVTLAGLTTSALAKDSGRVRSDMMVGVPSTMTGSAGNIRGIVGGGLPWSIGDAEISVDASGGIHAEFENLVFSAGPNSGKNTIGSMAIVVSCLDATNHPVNVTSAPFPVTVASATDPGGDADVETRVTLPTPCFAPIAFITNATGAVWFAVDGL